MRLVITIVNSSDEVNLVKNMMKNGFYATKLATSGGFLRSGNVTLMTGVEDGKVDELIALIRKYSSRRKRIVQPMPQYGDDVFAAAPVEIEAGGATVFVLPVDNFLKL